MKRIIYCLALLCPFFSMCRPLTIHGKVINTLGLPISGATVTIVKSNNAGITNKAGEFTLKHTSSQDTVRISCPGYQTTIVPNNERGLLTVLLKRSFNKADNHSLRPLAVGDTMPPFLLSNIINWPATQINLAELSHKLVILDFWGTWCNSCLKGFSKLDSLQKQFPLQLQPILVNNTLTTADTGKIIQEYLIKRNQSPKTAIRFPIAIEDGPELQQLFPRIFLPHYVWLYQNKVVAITLSRDLTSNNIQDVLSGKPHFMKAKDDQVNQNP
jgi:thiol-disulfide isomerase/thioredoxin